jgi:N-glycosylase/DNA lyase
LLRLPEGEPFDPEHTFRCGQIFRWRRHGDAWYGPYGQSALRVRRVSGGLEVCAQGAPVTAGEVRRFLALDDPLLGVRERLGDDPWLAASMDALPGLRVLRQDPWECFFNFVCSQNSNIPKIELSTERVARRWGTVYRWNDEVEVAVLPPFEVVAGLEVDALRPCALGYRSPYLVRSARFFAERSLSLEQLRSLHYNEALEALIALPGVGRKVADCILVFSLDKDEACPVDVWVRRVIHELYPRSLREYLPDAAARAEKALTAREYAAIRQFAWDRWGYLAGYAQQYLFHARRLGYIGGGIAYGTDGSRVL